MRADHRPASELRYLTGFAQELSSEALPGALPLGRNSPQRCPYGLYAEQLSGTAFTAPRHANRRSWLYRIRPSVVGGAYAPLEHAGIAADLEPAPAPEPLRWDPTPWPEAPTDFVDGLAAWCGNGAADAQLGCTIYRYAANRSMADRYFADADGELLLVPQQGALQIDTEFGRLLVEPGACAVIPRGVVFRVDLPDVQARGTVCENFGAPLRLPELGPIGSNGLANARDFRTPVAWFEDRPVAGRRVQKYLGHLWSAPIAHSPLDVVAWHGSHAPYQYDLSRFNTLGSVSYDHPDPSIFTVLQSPSDTPGTSQLDFVVFPPRWQVAEQTFRPPWFHRNVASEFMGLIRGAYDAKAEGFVPGGASLHACMTPHGPDRASVEAAHAADTARPDRLDGGLAFMFESRLPLRPTRAALHSRQRQATYRDCWQDLRVHFDPSRP